jgi:hypothetical protein
VKVRAHIRVGRNTQSARRPYRVDASASPNQMPLVSSTGHTLPTVTFAIDLNIPDELFEQAQRVIAEITIPPEAAQIAAEVKQ